MSVFRILNEIKKAKSAGKQGEVTLYQADGPFRVHTEHLHHNEYFASIEVEPAEAFYIPLDAVLRVYVKWETPDA